VPELPRVEESDRLPLEMHLQAGQARSRRGAQAGWTQLQRFLASLLSGEGSSLLTALRAIHRATIQRAFMCQCMSGGNCICGQEGCTSTAQTPGGCCASKKRSFDQTTPSLDSSLSGHTSASLAWPEAMTPLDLGNLPQPSIPLPEGCYTGIWPTPSQTDSSQALPVSFNGP
jgi:hypothetical protein